MLKKKIPILALNLLILLGIFVIAELLILPRRYGLPRDALLMGFVASPGSLVDDTRINAMGFTGDTIDPVKPPRTIRILTLGGSAMFNRRMTERLRERLKRISTKNIEIVGAALRTHTTMSSVLKYELLRKYSFDFVLIYHGTNDLWANHLPIEDFRDDYSHLNPWYKRNLLLDKCIICRKIYNRWIYSRVSSGPAENLSGFASEKTFK